MKIRIYSVSDSDKHFVVAIDEYLKRLGKMVELIDLKPIKNGTPQQIIAKETDLLIDKVSAEQAKGRKVFLLSKEGKTHTTEQFASILSEQSEVTFLIGGPYGLEESRLSMVNGKLSFGAHTMPHGLAKLVLLEQIYRAIMIAGNKSYHY